MAYVHALTNREIPVDILPVEIPTTPTLEVNADFRLMILHIVNPTAITAPPGVTIVVSVSDGQATPIYLLPPVELPPGGLIHLDYNVNNKILGHRMPGGFKWSASAAGLHGYAAGLLLTQ